MTEGSVAPGCGADVVAGKGRFSYAGGDLVTSYRINGSGVDLSGKIVAIYGMGDQIGYTEWFVDAMGMLSDAIAGQDCQRIGFWSTEGYQFDKSKAVTPDGEWFVGLALDDENQYDQTDERLLGWTAQLVSELAELG